MAAINDPNLRQTALQIVSAPDFDKSEEGMIRALDSWRRALTPQQRQVAADAFTLSYLLDMRAEYERDSPAEAQRDAPAPFPEIRFVEPEPGPEREDGSDDASEAMLRFSSESDNWTKPPVPGDVSGAECLPVPVTRRVPTPTSPRFGPVSITHVADRTPKPEPQRLPAAVQQDGWKVPAFRNMKVFPSLANRVTVGGVAKREGELTRQEIPIRRHQIAQQLQTHRDKNTHVQALNDRRRELIQHDEAEMRVRDALDRELLREDGRLDSAGRVLVEHPDDTTITQLDADVLVECGYERRSE